MYPKFKSNLVALSVALGVLVAGYGLGEPPSHPVSVQSDAALVGLAADEAQAAVDEAARTLSLRRGALKAQIGMPFVSMATLLPRQES